MEVTILGREEGEALTQVAPGVFDAEIDAQLVAEFLADPRHHLAVARAGGTIVGMASALHYVHPDKPPELWINEVGVAPSHQGQGVGTQLLRCLLAHGRQLGCAEAWVLTDSANVAATGLYSAVGGRAEPCVMFTFQL